MSAIIVVGMVFGDEGKGATTDFLVRQHKADLVVRYNGGAQAAHNVVTSDGRHHTFCQFGSGTFVPGVRTHLSRFVLVNPLTMLNEETFLQKAGVTDAFDRISVDKKALIITPFQKALNRLLEMSRGDGKHGSCGQGIGQTREFSLRFGDAVLVAGDLTDFKKTRDKLEFHRAEALKDFKGCGPDLAPQSMEWFDEMITLHNHKIIGDCLTKCSRWINRIRLVDSLAEVTTESPIVFEGAQGVLLDEKHGFLPYVTWTNTTCENAVTLLNEISYKDNVHKIGVFRKYFTRHGAGPFPSEDLEQNDWAPEPHNKTEIYQDKFRVGFFDIELAKKAIRICPIDSIALNHLDVATPCLLPFTKQDDILAVQSERIINTIEEHTKTPISILGNGPTAAHRRMR